MGRAAIAVLCLVAALAALFLWAPSLEVARFPADNCNAFTAWLQRQKQHEKHVDQHILAGIQFLDEELLSSAASGGTLEEDRGVLFHHSDYYPKPTILSSENKSNMKFKRPFATLSTHTLEQILSVPALQTSAYLIVVSSSAKNKSKNQTKLSSSPNRRQDGQPFISIAPNFDSSSSSKLLNDFLPLETLNAAAPFLEYALLQNRKLFAFTVETAKTLPLCKSGTGACALWEAATGRIILDENMVVKMHETRGLSLLLDAFAQYFPQSLVGVLKEEGEYNNTSVKTTSEEAENVEDFSHYYYSVSRVAGFVARAAGATVASIFASQLPLWWCLLCPIVLGILAPFVFNYGLAAVAEELCGVLQLSPGACSDLWWSAFAVAMVLSLGSAIPIVYVCRLPDCVKRGVEAKHSPM